MNLSTIVALLSIAMTFLGKSAGTPLQGQAISMANQAIVVAEQWIDENTVSTTPTATTALQPTINQPIVANPVMPVRTPAPVTVAPTQPVTPVTVLAVPAAPVVSITPIATTTPVVVVASTTPALSTPTVEMIGIGCGYPCPDSYTLSSAQIQQNIATTIGNAERNAGDDTVTQTNKIIAQNLQDSELASWVISVPDNTDLTGMKITVDPGLRGYITGLSVSVSGNPWTSMDGITWVGSHTISGGGSNFATIDVYANIEQGNTATFSNGVTLTGLTGTDLVTGAVINQ